MKNISGCLNKNYQAFLDTLEQSELDKLKSDVEYMKFISERSVEFNAIVNKDSTFNGIRDTAFATYIRAMGRCPSF